jgi:hypothetical protein
MIAHWKRSTGKTETAHLRDLGNTRNIDKVRKGRRSCADDRQAGSE